MRFSLPALVVVVLALLPAAASGATVGSSALTGGPSDVPLAGAITYVQATDGAGQPSFAVPAGGGVITAWKARVGAGSGTNATFKLKVLRPAGASQWQVVGEAPGTITGASLFAEAAFPDVRIPVQAGDRLGIFVPGAGPAAGGSANATGSSLTSFSGDASGTFTAGSPTANVRLNLEATVEPDADGDGYGDTTQDACPQLADRHVGPCDTDVALTTSAPPALGAGGVATVVLTATANPGPATAAVGTVVLPAGVEVLAASTTGGECTGTGTLTCAFGDIPGGGTRKAFLVLRPTKPGSQTIVSTVQSGVPDPAPANNTVSTVLNVGAPTGAQSVTLCKVPKLAGLSASAAKKRLASAGCKLGATGGAKGKAARVRTQSIPAGVKVVAGTKVAVGLGLPKAKTKARR